ncbi:Alpha/beta hydrolase domain-containing protein 11, partial [Orchesella cincta]
MLGVKSQWDLIAKKIADETSRNVIAFDARCHGESPNLGELSYESMADDITKLTQFLKIDKFSLLGHSIGGKTAMTVALKYPELLDKLVVVDVTPVEKWLDPQAIKGYYLAVHSILSNPNTSRLSLPEVKQLVINALTKLDCEILTRDFLTTYLGDGDRRVVWTGKPSLDIIIENIEELIGFRSHFSI